MVKFLDSDRNQERSLQEIATEVVDGYHEFLVAGIKKPVTPLRVGMLLRTPLDAKVWRVAWMDDERQEVWIVSENSSYGYLYQGESEFWGRCEEFRPSHMVDTGEPGLNGKPKRRRVEMTDEEIDQAWSNPDWKAGDRFSQHQREFLYEVIAAGPQCVLMIRVGGRVLMADSNASLAKYYKREVKGLDSEW